MFKNNYNASYSWINVKLYLPQKSSPSQQIKDTEVVGGGEYLVDGELYREIFDITMKGEAGGEGGGGGGGGGIIFP